MANEGGAGGSYVLVHVRGDRAKAPLFAPLRLVNPVTYVGRLQGNDVVLNSSNVSRRHAKLIVTDLGVTVHDLDSHNGIFLNGKKVRSTPIAAGDRLYVGDVCVELQMSEDETPTGSHSLVTHEEISDEDDGRARSLATLLRVSDLCGAGPEETWAAEVVQYCRELVEANVAVLVEVHSDGELETPVVLQPTQGASKKGGGAPVVWGVVQRAIETQQPQLTRDLAESNLVDVVKDGDPKAVMAVPVLVQDAGVAAVIFLSRPSAGPNFTELELETLGAASRLIGLRLERARRPAEVTSVGTDMAAVLSAQAKLASAEDQLSREQQEVKRLTDRVHSLEGDALKLRQQNDLDRQSALKSAAEKEKETLAKLEASLVEQKKAAQKELAAAAKEAEKLRSEVEKQKEAQKLVEEDRKARLAELEKQKQRAQEAEDQLAELKAQQKSSESRMSELEAVATKLQTTEQASSDAAAAAATALRQALRASVPPTLVDHVEAVAAGDPTTTPAHARQLTVLYLALSDFDSFCDKAQPDDVKARLDRFCAAVAARAPANGGRIDQIVGHGHLLVFAADPQSVRSAVRCALEVTAIVDAEASADAQVPGVPEPAVVAGLHMGTAIAGFFGGEDGVSYVEAGLPLVVARAAIEQAPPGKDGGPRGVIVSEPVRAVVAGDPGFRVTRLGQSWIKGVNAPVQLALVELDEDGGG